MVTSELKAKKPQKQITAKPITQKATKVQQSLSKIEQAKRQMLTVDSKDQLYTSELLKDANLFGYSEENNPAAIK